MELSIDTSTDWGGIALSRQGELLAEIIWKPGQNHTVELYPNITRLIEIAGVDLQTVTAIFVAIGPGSFNGLRAGISAAKGLSFELNVPLKGIGTLAIEAYPFAFTSLPICPLHDAGRGEVAAARYRFDNEWKCLREEHITTIDKLPAEIMETTVFCGELSETSLTSLRLVMGEKAIIPGTEARQRKPSMLAALGWQRLQSEGPDNLASLQPIYLRQPPITQRKKKY